MCDTCGCGDSAPNLVTITKIGEEKKHEHFHSHSSGEYDHARYHPHRHEGLQAQEHPDPVHRYDPLEPVREKTFVRLEQDILHKNDRIAAYNRGYFEAKNVLSLNLVSSPGAGKTTLLEQTLNDLKNELPCFVIEGDQQTANDARRIAATGVPVVQINTGKGCHLDAEMIRKALRQLSPSDHSVLFIENVGNLICPALFDLGESARVVLISVTEGDDKPAKYPDIFHAADLCIINKTDLLPYVRFDLSQVKTHARRVNPGLKFIELSATTGEGLHQWYAWLKDRMG